MLNLMKMFDRDHKNVILAWKGREIVVKIVNIEAWDSCTAH